MKINKQELYTQSDVHMAAGVTLHQFKLDQDAGLIPCPTMRPLGRRAYYTPKEKKLILAFYAGERTGARVLIYNPEEGTNANS